MTQDSDEVSTIADAGEILFDLEAEHDLFEVEIAGVPIWEQIRFPVVYRILEAYDVTGQAHAGNSTSQAATLYRMLRSLVVRSPLFADTADLLVWGHERRKQLDDGRWMDIYCDPVMDAVPSSVTYLEEQHEGTHLTPTVTDDVRHLDFVQHSGNLVRKLVADDVLLSRDEHERLDDIETLLTDAFGTTPDLAALAGARLLNRRVKLPLYEAIIRRVDPAIALLVVSYGREPFVEACQRQGIPTVELQHGVISRYHFGYSYPGGYQKHTFPDYFFSFGTFWDETVDYPLPADRVYPVGYPYLEDRVASLEAVQSTDQVVFVSQGTTGPKLSRFALDVADQVPDVDIVYKLHPGEYSRWRSEYPWLVDAPFEVVADERELYDLFAESSAQVGVYSTAIYEGLCFDLDTYVVDLPGVGYMEYLLETDAAQVVRTPAELGAALNRRGSTPIDTDPFFKPNALENVRAALDAVRRRESVE